MSCKDGIDNDDDGTVDAMDPDCFNGLKEDGSEPEVEMEILDGHDNDCDGYVLPLNWIVMMMGLSFFLQRVWLQY